MVEFFTMPENFPVARKLSTPFFRSIESLILIIQVWVAKFIIGSCNSEYSTKEAHKNSCYLNLLEQKWQTGMGYRAAQQTRFQ
jgi:hypothetical protein